MTGASTDRPRLGFPLGFTELDEYEVGLKGYYGQAVAEFSDGTYVPVFFYDLTRLSQDLEHDLRHGDVCIAEPGLIVVPSVDRASMERAIDSLAAKGFFDSFVRKHRSSGDSNSQR